MCITRCRTYQPHENTSRAEKTLSKAEGTRNRTTQAHRRVDDGKPFLRPYARLHDGAGCPDRRSGRHSNEPRHHRHAGAGAAVGAISKPASARSGARLSGRGLADFRRAEYLRAVPGVETVALASWPLLSGYSSNDAVAVDGGPPSEDMAFFFECLARLGRRDEDSLHGRQGLPCGRHVSGCGHRQRNVREAIFPGQKSRGKVVRESVG